MHVANSVAYNFWHSTGSIKFSSILIFRLLAREPEFLLRSDERRALHAFSFRARPAQSR
jgi:hypothetical protein